MHTMADDDGEADNGKQGNHVRDLGPQSANARCTRFSYATANRLRNLDGNLNEKKQRPMKSIIINQQLASPLSEPNGTGHAPRTNMQCLLVATNHGYTLELWMIRDLSYHLFSTVEVKITISVSTGRAGRWCSVRR